VVRGRGGRGKGKESSRERGRSEGVRYREEGREGKDQEEKEAMREDTARAVLRDARQRGHDHVELRRDGPHTIFYCNLCGTRCYSDAALADHLNGNRHGRRSAMTRASSLVVREQQLPQSWPTVVPASRSLLKRPGEETESESTAVAMVSQNGGGDIGGKSREEIVPGLTGSATTSLRWMGSGQLFLKMLGNGGAPPVEAAWFCWYGMHRPVEVIWQDGSAGRMEYAVVVFPYSDRIGRGGDWTSLNTSDENLDVSVAGNKGAVDSRSAQSENSEITASEVTAPREIVVHTQTAPSAQLDTAPCSLTLTIRTKSGEALAGDAPQEDGEQVKLLISKEEPITTYRRGWKRKQAKIADRICFICHQKLLPGKDVAALVNVKSGQMVCGSRNRRGVLLMHYHSLLVQNIFFK
jgi:hypothetical protein